MMLGLSSLKTVRVRLREDYKIEILKNNDDARFIFIEDGKSTLRMRVHGGMPGLGEISKGALRIRLHTGECQV